MIRNLPDDDKISYILIGIFIGMMVGYFIGLITPDIHMALYGF